MVTGEHVEVFREAVAPGERRRYTKRFLNTRDGDFGQWTEREWRILARLIGHGIALRARRRAVRPWRVGGEQLVQTYDAGVTVDQWATLLPVARDGCVYRHVFEDCAHWWAFAHHCLRRAARDPSARSSSTSTSRATTSAFRMRRRTSIRIPRASGCSRCSRSSR